MKMGLEAALFRLGRGRERGRDGGDGEAAVTEGSGDGNVEGEKKKGDTSVNPSELEIVFDEALGKEDKGKKVCRYQLNPRPNWGPMNRAGGS
jgi:tRNA (guanine26-N2/guanine27-N2)-dimethyltransferase